MKAILITLDCVRADHLDGPRVATPELDALRAEGTSFTQAFAQSQSTLPSHLTMLSSNYLFQHGVYSNHEQVELPPHALPRRLEQQGWACGAFASIEFLARGLADQVGERDGRFNHPDAPVWSRGLQRLRGYPSRLDGRSTLRAGLRWLHRHDGAHDAFLWLHFFDAHMVYSAPRRLLREEVTPERTQRSCQESIRERGWFCTPYAEYEQHVPVEHFPARYRAAVRHLDALLGDLVRVLKRRGWWDEVLLVVTSDHGECLLGDHGMYCMHQKLFDTTVHVPLWIRFPGGAHAGREVDALVEHVDLAPTFAACAGFDEPLFMGRDLTAVASGRERGREVVFSEHVDGLLRAARDSEHLLVERVPGSPNRLGLPLEEEELFERDGRVAPAQARERGQRLRSAWEDLLEARPEVRAAWAGTTEVDEGVAAQLRDLGYL